MNTESEPVVLCLAVAVVSVKEAVKIVKRKYRVKNTGKNYVKTLDPLGQDYDNGFSGPLPRRVGIDELLHPTDPSYFRFGSEIVKKVYYLEPDEKQAMVNLKASLGNAVTLNNNNAKLMMDHWVASDLFNQPSN